MYIYVQFWFTLFDSGKDPKEILFEFSEFKTIARHCSRIPEQSRTNKSLMFRYYNHKLLKILNQGYKNSWKNFEYWKIKQYGKLLYYFNNKQLKNFKRH